MATTLIDWRPSALPAARALGFTADGVYVPGCASQVTAKSVASTTQRNNSMGALSAAMHAEGATTSELAGLGAGILRRQRDAAAGTVSKSVVSKHSMKGIDARGIPPRGRRKV